MKKIKFYNKIIIFMIISILINSFTMINVSAKESNYLYDIISSKAEIDSQIDFSKPSSDTNGKGVYTITSTKEDKNPIHYYRGDVDDNNVLFANFCWHIVRTTETGGIKLIYNGVPTDEKCDNTASASRINSSMYNSNNANLSYTGYMYEDNYKVSIPFLQGASANFVYGNDVTYENGVYTLKDTFTSTDYSADYQTIGKKYHYSCLSTADTCSEVYYLFYTAFPQGVYHITLTDGKRIEEAVAEMTTGSNNNQDSLIKTVVDDWYKNNMTSYTNYLEDTIWYNNRQISEFAGWGKDTNAATPLWFKSVSNLDQATPSVKGNIKNDSFTVSEANGNGKLTYPVGLITLDEGIYAGLIFSEESSTYLNTGESWWTMSPGTFTNLSNNYIVTELGYLAPKSTASVQGVRPSISLNNNVMVKNGDGTKDAPYIIADQYKLTIETEEKFTSYFTDWNNKLFSENETININILKVGKVYNGYKFLGYESEDVKTNEDGTFTMPNKDVVIKPIFEKVTIKEEIKEAIKNPETMTFVGMTGLVLLISGIIYITLKKNKVSKY